MNKLQKKTWLKLIDEYMGLNKRASLSWSELIELEGGYGQDKIKSVEEALLAKNEGTWPGIWFQSGQTDFSVYNRYDYIYSLLFGRQISGQTISLAASSLLGRSASLQVVDWGGSIYTAVDLLTLAPDLDHVWLVNYEGPQLDFAAWAIRQEPLEELAGRIAILTEDDAKNFPHIAGPIDNGSELVFLFSEVLEHIKEPLEYFDNLHVSYGFEEAFIANSFATPAYGHFIPINMDGRECGTPRIANRAWREGMTRRGWKLSKVEGWNSRLWHVTR